MSQTSTGSDKLLTSAQKRLEEMLKRVQPYVDEPIVISEPRRQKWVNSRQKAFEFLKIADQKYQPLKDKITHNTNNRVNILDEVEKPAILPCSSEFDLEKEDYVWKSCPEERNS